MGLFRHWLSITLRRQGREIAAVVVLLGLLGGVSLWALAGARRTQSSYPRFLRAAHASTMAIDPGQYDPEADATIAAFPNVERSATYVAFQTGPMVGGQPDFDQDFETLGTPNGRFFTMDRFHATKGRLPDPHREDEIAFNQVAARRYGYHVGQHLDLGTYSAEQTGTDDFFEHPPAPALRTKATIVGIGLFVDEVLQDDTNRLPLALVTPAFSKRAAPYATYAWQGLVLRHGDADVAAVKQRYISLADPGTPQFFRVTSVDTFHTQQAVRPLSLALAAFGAIAGLAALVLVTQAVGRMLRRAQTEQEVLRALGASPTALLGTSLGGPLVSLVLGVVLAVGLAFLASPLMPLGAMRRVEVHRGLDADLTVLGLLAGAALVVLVLAATVSAASELPHRRSGRRTGSRPSRVVAAANGAGMSPAAVAGLRLAFSRGDRSTAVPVRSVMLAGVIAIAVLVAALTFGASFHRLLDAPDLYGWNWDTTLLDSSGYGNLDVDASHSLLDDMAGVAGWSGAYFGADSLDGANVPLLGMELGSKVTPPILSGRMITAADEVVLGSATARALGTSVGEDVTIGVAPNRAKLHVVGTATFPTIGIVHGAHTSLGVGALVVPDRVPGFDRQLAGEGPPGTGARPVGPPAIFVRYRTDADARTVRRAIARGARDIGEYPGSTEVLGAQRPAEIVNSRQVGSVPAVLAVALGAAAAVSLALALASSVRRRRHEFALLRALGFTPRQLGTSIAWQATATIVVGLLVGVPVGVALGRSLWTAFASQLDVVSRPAVPLGLLALVGAAAIVVANVVAAVPARWVQRVKPATALSAD